MRRQTIKEELTHTPGILPEEYHLYIVRDSETVFYVGQAANPHNRLLTHLGMNTSGGGSALGAFLLENVPVSREWVFEQYTVEECREVVLNYRATFPPEIQDFYRATGNHIDVDDAEEALIKLHRPPFNTAMNPQPLPLPDRYKSSYHLPFVDPLADLLEETFFGE